MINCERCNRGEAHLHQPGEIHSGEWTQMDTEYVRKVEAERDALKLQISELKELARLPIGPLEMRDRFIEKMWPTEKRKEGS